ncbi:MAG: aconitase X [Rhizobium rhizophilum]|uniref:cis-3-hydroxy-L-proline dehydratase n=1 Tax=Rhizobium rhizophilum TaxID=1850373 RepID=UPI00391B19C1
MSSLTDTVDITGRVLVSGSAEGEVLFTDTALSFWGGADAVTGEIIDRHHPLSGERLTGRVLALPTSRGSCTGSGVILELILNGQGPAAIVLEHPEAIITLGVIVAEEVFGRSIPVIAVGNEAFAALKTVKRVRISDAVAGIGSDIALTDKDKAILGGERGEAAAVAMRIVLRMAVLEGAKELIDISRAHVDGCIYTGPGGLAFAEKLRDLGGHVVVPTTLNAISVDHRRWQAQGVSEALGRPASAVADAYVAMGAQATFTCAPYLLDDRPARDEQIVWAESNAVVYANSVLGARTMKYPDYLDIAIALTGRAPKAGCHLPEERAPQVRVTVPPLEGVDDSLWPLLGYLIGTISPDAIPLVEGVSAHRPDTDALKALGAAFATTSAAPMFHIAGVTPEALEPMAFADLDLPTTSLTNQDLQRAWRELNGADVGPVQLVSLGNPHFSATELATLAALCRNKTRAPGVPLVITCGRAQMAKAEAAGDVAVLSAFGVTLVNDTCWCMVTEPIIPVDALTIMTNSGKYAHYGPGLTGRTMRFGSLAACVEAAVTGEDRGDLPAWLG